MFHGFLLPRIRLPLECRRRFDQSGNSTLSLFLLSLLARDFSLSHLFKLFQGNSLGNLAPFQVVLNALTFLFLGKTVCPHNAADRD